MKPALIYTLQNYTFLRQLYKNVSTKNRDIGNVHAKARISRDGPLPIGKKVTRYLHIVTVKSN